MIFVEDPKWCYWSGKLGWDGFDKDSWDVLDGLYKKAMDTNMPKTAKLNVGKWDYEITVDPHMKDETHPEACGYQVALHENSPNKTKRHIMKRW